MRSEISFRQSVQRLMAVAGAIVGNYLAPLPTMAQVTDDPDRDGVSSSELSDKYERDYDTNWDQFEQCFRYEAHYSDLCYVNFSGVEIPVGYVVEYYHPTNQITTSNLPGADGYIDEQVWKSNAKTYLKDHEESRGKELENASARAAAAGRIPAKIDYKKPLPSAVDALYDDVQKTRLTGSKAQGNPTQEWAVNPTMFMREFAGELNFPEYGLCHMILPNYVGTGNESFWRSDTGEGVSETRNSEDLSLSLWPEWSRAGLGIGGYDAYTGLRSNFDATGFLNKIGKESGTSSLFAFGTFLRGRVFPWVIDQTVARYPALQLNATAKMLYGMMVFSPDSGNSPLMELFGVTGPLAYYNYIPFYDDVAATDFSNPEVNLPLINRCLGLDYIPQLTLSGANMPGKEPHSSFTQWSHFRCCFARAGYAHSYVRPQ